VYLHRIHGYSLYIRGKQGISLQRAVRRRLATPPNLPSELATTCVLRNSTVFSVACEYILNHFARQRRWFAAK
jgi:hypothetical protein